MRRLFALLASIGIILLLVGCSALQPPPLPTVANLEMAGTQQYQTLNAPPANGQQVAFPQIDANLASLPSWHSISTLTFDGVYAGTNDPAQGTIRIEIYMNGLASAQRVLLKASGAAFGLDAPRDLEAVRIGNDYYLVDSNKVCTKPTDPNTQSLANLTAGVFIGGVKNATYSGGHNKTTDSQGKELQVWEYTFLPEDVVVPTSITLSDGGAVSIASGDLWVTFPKDIVSQYTITWTLKGAFLPFLQSQKQSDRQLSGRLEADYTLVDTGVDYNISVPFGC